MSREARTVCETRGKHGTRRDVSWSGVPVCGDCGGPHAGWPGPVMAYGLRWVGRPPWKAHGSGGGQLVLQAHIRAPWVDVALEAWADKGVRRAVSHTLDEGQARAMLRFLRRVFPDEAPSALPVAGDGDSCGPCTDGDHASCDGICACRPCAKADAEASPASLEVCRDGACPGHGEHPASEHAPEGTTPGRQV